MQTLQGSFNEHKIKCDSLHTKFVEYGENIFDDRFRQLSYDFTKVDFLRIEYEKTGDKRYALEYIHNVQKLEDGIRHVLG